MYFGTHFTRLQRKDFGTNFVIAVTTVFLKTFQASSISFVNDIEEAWNEWSESTQIDLEVPSHSRSNLFLFALPKL